MFLSIQFFLELQKNVNKGFQGRRFVFSLEKIFFSHFPSEYISGSQTYGWNPGLNQLAFYSNPALPWILLGLVLRHTHMDVSENRCTRKWMVYNGKPYLNWWFGGTPIFGNTHIYPVSIKGRLPLFVVKKGPAEYPQASKFCIVNHVSTVGTHVAPLHGSWNQYEIIN